MKNLTTLLPLLLCSFSLFCQEQFNKENSDAYFSNKNIFSLRVGAAMPLGNFGDSNSENEGVGLATQGLSIDIGFIHDQSDFIYLTLTSKFTFNNINEFDLRDRFYFSPDYNISVETTPWVNLNVMGGFGTLVPLNDDIEFLTRFLAGIGFTTSPSFNVVLTNGSTSIINKQTKQQTSSLSYLVGASVKIKISENISFLLSGDYLGLDAELEDIEFSSFNSASNSRFSEKFSVKQEIKILTLSAGLTFQI